MRCNKNPSRSSSRAAVKWTRGMELEKEITRAGVNALFPSCFVILSRLLQSRTRILTWNVMFTSVCRSWTLQRCPRRGRGPMRLSAH